MRKRRRRSSRNDVTWTVSNENSAKLRVEKRTGHLRPKRSAIGPVVIAAIIKPKSPPEKIGPNVRMGIPILSAIEGAIKLMACESNPSSTSTRPQRTMRPDLVTAQRAVLDDLGDGEGL